MRARQGRASVAVASFIATGAVIAVGFFPGGNALPSDLTRLVETSLRFNDMYCSNIARLRGGGDTPGCLPCARNHKEKGGGGGGRGHPLGFLPCIRRKTIIRHVPPPEPKLDFNEVYLKVIEIVTLLFPVWLTVAFTSALLAPNSFNWLSTEVFKVVQVSNVEIEIDPFSLCMGIAMLSMGMSLHMSDFQRLVTDKDTAVPLLISAAIQFVATPAIAAGISLFVSAPTGIGLCLLSACPGTQLSNVVTFIAGGNLELSICMSVISTLLSPVVMPLIFRILTGNQIVMDDLGMFFSMCKLVLIPVMTGMYINTMLPHVTNYIKPITPVLSMVLTVCLSASAVAVIHPEVLHGGIGVGLPVVLLHTLSGLIGYLLPRKVWNLSERTSKTVAIQATMHSAALGYHLAMKHFDDLLIAVPSAVGIVVMTWLGALLSSLWRFRMGFEDLFPEQLSVGGEGQRGKEGDKKEKKKEKQKKEPSKR